MSNARNLANLLNTDTTIATADVANGGITTAKLADDAVTSAKLDTNIAIGGTLGVTGVLTANAGVSVDNITIDGTEIDLSSGDLTIDVAGDIILDADGADIKLKDGGTQFGQLYKNGNDFRVESNVSDGDLVFTGNDGGVGVTAMTIDMSEGGRVGIGLAPDPSVKVSINGGVGTTNGGAGGPTHTFYSDPDTGMFRAGANALGFTTGGSERVRIDATGLGIGISSQGSKLHVHDTASSGTANAVIAQFTQSSNSSSAGSQGLQSTIRLGGQTRYVSLNSHHNQFQDANTSFSISTDGGSGQTERMRIDNLGQVFFNGVTSLTTAESTTIQDDGMIYQNRSSSAGAFHMRFRNGSNFVGSITSNTTTTFYNTSSDYRLKENVIYDFDATTRLKKLKPCRFNFKNNTDTTVDGFIAHEVSDVISEAVFGEKDAMEIETKYTADDKETQGDNPTKKIGDAKTYSTTDIQAQAIDQSKLVPLLTKALQELEARITVLESA